MIRNILVVSIIAILLTGCSSIPNILQVNTTPVERQPIVLPSVDEFNSREVEWIVVTPENANDVWADLLESDQPIVIFALTDDGWKNLSLNLADIMKLVEQQRSIIAAYKKYYEDTPE